jgi:predicted DNA-binding transcriptional regulator AlpA
MPEEQFPTATEKAEPFLTAKEVGKAIGQHPKTILSWARQGIIPYAEKATQAYVRFKLSEVRAALKQNARS